MGVRRLWALIKGLPPDSATWRQDRPGWSQADELAAQLVEAVHHWGAIHTRILAPKAKKLPPVERFITHPDRPVPEPPKNITKDPREVAAFFSKHMKGG